MAVTNAAAEIGRKRDVIQRAQVNVRRDVMELLPRAAEAGISLSALADLTGISRQTLYAWIRADRR